MSLWLMRKLLSIPLRSKVPYGLYFVLLYLFVHWSMHFFYFFFGSYIYLAYARHVVPASSKSPSIFLIGGARWSMRLIFKSQWLTFFSTVPLWHWHFWRKIVEQARQVIIQGIHLLQWVLSNLVLLWALKFSYNFSKLSYMIYPNMSNINTKYTMKLVCV